MQKPTLGALTLNILDMKPTYPKAIVKHQIPTRDGDRIQNMGFDSRQWSFKCEFLGASKDANVATLNGYYTNDDTVVFTDEAGTAFNVKISELTIVRENTDTKISCELILIEVD